MTAQHAQLRADDRADSPAKTAAAIAERTVWSFEIKLLIVFGTMLFGIGAWVARQDSRVGAVEEAVKQISADVESRIRPIREDMKDMAGDVRKISDLVSEIRGQLRGVSPSSMSSSPSWLRNMAAEPAEKRNIQ